MLNQSGPKKRENTSTALLGSMVAVDWRVEPPPNDAPSPVAVVPVMVVASSNLQLHPPG